MRSLTRLSLALALLSACSDAPATKSAAPITAAAGADAGGGPASASAVPTPANCNQSVFDAWVKKVATELAGQRYKTWWGNELHPTSAGFAKVAALFDAAL